MLRKSGELDAQGARKRPKLTVGFIAAGYGWRMNEAYPPQMSMIPAFHTVRFLAVILRPSYTYTCGVRAARANRHRLRTNRI